MKRLFCLLCALALLGAAYAEETDGDCVYRLYTAEGDYLTARAGRMYEGDEYVAGDDREYRVIRVDDASCAAYAESADGVSPVFRDAAPDSGLWTALLGGTARAEGKGAIGMYSTHSDESYVPGDGDSSLWKGAGIYDVGSAFQKELEKRGYDVEYSHETFLPHDAGAYSRSASTAEELLKESPEALFDIHRDGVGADEYETEVDGQDVSKVRLFVGRSNANRDANMAFAKAIKAEADKRYPGLVKDIYMGKGNYNQELYPHALLLEFGTHEIEKDKVLDSVPYMAEVVDAVLGGGSAKAEAADAGKQNAGAGRGILWIVGIAVLAAAIYALASTGRLKGLWNRVKRSAGELTGLGKKR